MDDPDVELSTEPDGPAAQEAEPAERAASLPGASVGEDVPAEPDGQTGQEQRAAAGPAAAPPAAATVEEAGEQNPPGPPREGGPLPPPSSPPGAVRPVPVYNGRPASPPSAGEVLLGVPRLLLQPLHLTLEYVVRRPVVRLMAWTEKHHLHRKVERLFLWKGGKMGLFPTALYELGQRPNVGFYLYHDDLLVPGQETVLRGGFWLHNWQQVLALTRLPVFLPGTGELTLQARYGNRPDHPFYGRGPETEQSDLCFFRSREAELFARLYSMMSGLNRLSFALTLRSVGFSDGQDPPVSQRFPSLPGFSDYELIDLRYLLELDSRNPDRTRSSGTGLRLELLGGYSIDPLRTELQLFRWGVEAAGFLDVSGAGHVLGLRVFAEFLERIGNEPAPVTELVNLGGLELMRGFLGGRFRGMGAIEVTGDYRYPIHHLVDANLFVSMGNTSEAHLDGLSLSKMYLSWGLGVRTNTRRNTSFDLLLGFGSSRLDSGSFAVDSVHLTAGINQGF